MFSCKDVKCCFFAHPSHVVSAICEQLLARLVLVQITLALPESDTLGEIYCLFLAHKMVSEELSPKQGFPGGIYNPCKGVWCSNSNSFSALLSAFFSKGKHKHVLSSSAGLQLYKQKANTLSAVGSI